VNRPRSASAEWQHELLARFKRFAWLKAAGTTAFIWIFFVAYFDILHHPAHPVLPMPLTWLDDLIAFQPPALIAYASLWIYVSVPPALLHSFRELLAYACWTAALCLAALVCFHFWPTAVPAYPIDPTVFPGFRIIKGLDAPGNACPSLHVATAAFSVIWMHHLLRLIGTPGWLRTANWLWFVLIVYSTLATKQHVALDVFAGLLLGFAFAVPSLRLRPAR